MPNAREILDGLAAIADAWQGLAILWHLLFGSLGALVVFGWRPAQRVAGAVLILPIISVSLLAWLTGNPFNGTLFGALSVVLAFLLGALKTKKVEIASPVWLMPGVALFAFGWVYPHFLGAVPAVTYLYAAPLGLIPCPTLSLVVGATLSFRGLGSRAWSTALGGAGVFYGVFGSTYLSVPIDWLLSVGAIVLLASAFASRRTVR